MTPCSLIAENHQLGVPGSGGGIERSPFRFMTSEESQTGSGEWDSDVTVELVSLVRAQVQTVNGQPFSSGFLPMLVYGRGQ